MNVAINNPVIIRGSDMLTVVQIADNKKTIAKEVGLLAASAVSNFPNYKVDGAGAVLIFRTPKEAYVLGGVKSNPALKEEFADQATKTAFPQQINSTTGGGLSDPELSVRTAVVNAISKKMFLDAPMPEEGVQSQNILKDLRQTILEDSNWAQEVCVHSDKWTNKDGSIGTMCYLTTVKVIPCDDAYVAKIGAALANVMEVKKQDSTVKPWELTNYSFVPLAPLVQNSIDSSVKKELEKAKDAFAKFGNTVAVTFNDLSMAILAQTGVFNK